MADVQKCPKIFHRPPDGDGTDNGHVLHAGGGAGLDLAHHTHGELIGADLMVATTPRLPQQALALILKLFNVKNGPLGAFNDCDYFLDIHLGVKQIWHPLPRGPVRHHGGRHVKWFETKVATQTWS